MDFRARFLHQKKYQGLFEKKYFEQIVRLRSIAQKNNIIGIYTTQPESMCLEYTTPSCTFYTRNILEIKNTNEVYSVKYTSWFYNGHRCTLTAQGIYSLGAINFSNENGCKGVVLGDDEFGIIKINENMDNFIACKQECGARGSIDRDELFKISPLNIKKYYE